MPIVYGLRKGIDNRFRIFLYVLIKKLNTSGQFICVRILLSKILKMSGMFTEKFGHSYLRRVNKNTTVQNWIKALMYIGSPEVKGLARHAGKEHICVSVSCFD